jgi:prepilin-type N-terminal cleavage/methylation domain-containing protein/prepilin-type processing-associated H-X9-DG protein
MNAMARLDPRSDREACGFSLVELLVVIGVIGVLLGLLLPALSKARDQAQTVACQSNLRQLHDAFVLYSLLNHGYCMPARGANVDTGGSASNYWWLGRLMLGAVLNVQGTDKQQTDVLNRLAKVLDCPALDRHKAEGSNHNFSFDYTYNANLGDIAGQNSADPGYPAWHPAHAYKKWTQVPSNVLVCVDSSEPSQRDDERFDTSDELTWSRGFGGSPHARRTKGNALFHDGSVKLCKVWTPPGAGMRVMSSKPSNLSSCTELADWMICHPGHADPASINRKTAPEEIWQPGRALPF